MDSIDFKIIGADKRIFVLKKGISLDMGYFKDIIICNYAPLGISLSDNDGEKILTQFSEEFDFLWTEYAKEDDSNLTGDALLIKRHLLEIVDSVVDL